MIETYRELYASFIKQAKDAGLASNALDFNTNALHGVSASTRDAARAGNESAIVLVCDAAEAWLDAALSWDHGYPEDNDDAYAEAMWHRSCDAELRMGREQA
tara:strand:- start:683 stop:988 length:306 start_codon:yes stop_codon:yes gene_type:complete